MLGSTHVRIAETICKNLGIVEKREVGLLVGGSTSPDSWMDFPHHHGKEKEIADNLLQARRLYLESDDECFHRLGVALHYIADKWTLRPRMSDKHTEWERKIDTMPIIDDSKLKEAISESAIPTKVVEELLQFVDFVKAGPCELSGFAFAKNLTDYANHLRPGEFTTTDDKIENKVWSMPLFDLNFAYRICLEVSKAVLTLPPNENRSFYLRGKSLQEQLEKFPGSYITDNWETGSLQQVADINELTELTQRLCWNNIQNHILIFDYDSLRMEEAKVVKQIKKITKVKTTAGLFRKKEVEKERVIEETEEKTAYRVHLEMMPVTLRARDETLASVDGRIQGFLDCASKLCARYILDKLKCIANNPNCRERQSVREGPRDPSWTWRALSRRPGQKPSGDMDDIIPDRGQRRVYIRWGDFVNLRIPAQEHLEEMYRRFDADQDDLIRLKSNASTWF